MDGQQNIRRYLCLGVAVLLLGCCVHASTPIKGKVRPLTNEERKKFVMAHNNARSNPKAFAGVKQPTAANMKRMYWNSGLEAEAVAWTAVQVKRNKIGHGNSGVEKQKEFLKVLNTSSIGSLGQNLMGGLGEPTRTVNEWHKEGSHFNASVKRCVRGVCGHYTQVVWADTKYVGCGIGNMGKTPFLNCDYYPPGNWPGVNPYKKGKPCSLCSQYRKDGFTECEDGLCQPKDKCSPVTECKVVDTENCLCSEDDYNAIVNRLTNGTGLRIAPSSLSVVVVVVVVVLFISPSDIA